MKSHCILFPPFFLSCSYFSSILGWLQQSSPCPSAWSWQWRQHWLPAPGASWGRPLPSWRLPQQAPSWHSPKNVTCCWWVFGETNLLWISEVLIGHETSAFFNLTLLTSTRAGEIDRAAHFNGAAIEHRQALSQANRGQASGATAWSGGSGIRFDCWAEPEWDTQEYMCY